MTYRVADLRDEIERAFASADANDEVPADLLCRVLSTPRRIAALASVLEADEAMSVEALVDALEAREMIERDRRELAVVLHHCDLPLLADAGLVSVDFEAGRIAPTSTASSIAADRSTSREEAV